MDFDRDGTVDPFITRTVTIEVDTNGDGILESLDVGAIDFAKNGYDGYDVIDKGLNGFDHADIVDILSPNESTVTNNIAYGNDYSVTLKDDGKLLFRWGTIVKRPNDIRMQVTLDVPDLWTQDLDGDGLFDAYHVNRAELVITHDITNNPNDQVRPEDYENEAAIGRKPSYYIVVDPDDPTNTLWVSPVDSYAGSGAFLPSYFKLTDTGQIDLGAGGTEVYDPEGELVGYRNTDEDGNPIGTVLKDPSLIDLNAAAELPFSSSDLAGGFTPAFYTSTDRDPFEWSYDSDPSPYRQVFVGFSSREEAEAAGFTDEQLVSGPRWRLKSNKFGQDIPGVEIPLIPNSQPPFEKENIRYPVGEFTTTTINLLDWADENGNGVADDSPLLSSHGWVFVDPTRLDVDADGVIDEGWLEVTDSGGGVSAAGDALPAFPILSAITPNGLRLTPEFDTAVYLKGDRRDSAKIYDIQLVLEYGADPNDVALYDYGDAPDDDLLFNYQTVSDMQLAARARLKDGFYLGAPVDGEAVLEPDIDSEGGALADAQALGDDLSATDDEGNAVFFLTPLTASQPGEDPSVAYLEVTASIPEGESGYLSAWFDFDADGIWSSTEQVLTGEALSHGSQVVSFEVPEYDPSLLADNRVYARFILSDTATPGPYRNPLDLDFYGEVEDYLVDLTSGFDDVIGRDGSTWWAGLSDGEQFSRDNYGNSQENPWLTAAAADLNGDGIDDVAGYTAGGWRVGITDSTVSLAADPPLVATDVEVSWKFNYETLTGAGTSETPADEALALDLNGDGKDEIAYRNAAGQWTFLSYDGSFTDPGGLPTWDLKTYVDVRAGDFDGDGNEEIAGRKIETGGAADNWQVIDYDTDGSTLESSRWGGSWKPVPYLVLAGDFNADGFDDLAGRNSQGQWIVSTSDGESFDSGKNWGNLNPSYLVIGTGDVNGDGATDIITYDPAKANWWVGVADSDKENFNFTQFGNLNKKVKWVDFRIGDYTGDGRDDVATRNSRTGQWTVAVSTGEDFDPTPFGVWDNDVDWQNVLAGNFDAIPTIISEQEETPAVEGGDGGGGGGGGGPVEIPPDIDVPRTTDPDYTSLHLFSTVDVIGRFDGTTQGDLKNNDIPIINFDGLAKTSKDGVALYPINSEFGFNVTDFEGAEQKDFFFDPEYAEGFAGDIFDENGVPIGLAVSDAPTDTFKTPFRLGTWLVGMGGDAVKAETEHYMVMQQVLSDQAFPEDLEALLPLDDDLIVIGGDNDGKRVAALVDPNNPDYVGDLNGDGVVDIRDVLEPNESTVTENIAASSDYSVTLKDDGKLLFRWGNLVKRPNDVRLRTEIALPEEWAIPVDKKTGVLPLHRITEAELVVRHTISNNPNDQIRPEDYENEGATGRLPEYTEITSDVTLSDGTVLVAGTWVSNSDFYAGDGSFYPGLDPDDIDYTGVSADQITVLRDPNLIAQAQNTTLDTIGALSSDLVSGLTNAWYTTQDRDPFEPVPVEGSTYDVGPRWRLKSNKYGQDLPGVEIPQDPSAPPPPTSSEIKYEVGAYTETVINLLDWNGISPLSLSTGWITIAPGRLDEDGDGLIDEGWSSVNDSLEANDLLPTDPIITAVSPNGLRLSPNFDVSFYIKGDQKPVELYDTELVMSYEEVPIAERGDSITGTSEGDVLAGAGENTFFGDAGADLFVLNYGSDSIVASTIEDFTLEKGDAIGLIGFGITAANFDDTLFQQVSGTDLNLYAGSSTSDPLLATLTGVDQLLGVESFYLA